MPPYIAIEPESLNFILESLLKSTMQMWVLHDNDNTIYAIATTRIEVDNSSGTKNLLIFSLYAYRPVPQDMWIEGLAGFKVFASGRGCKNIVAFTIVPRIVELAQTLGARTDTHFIMWGV
jgi:hypothetical protein